MSNANAGCVLANASRLGKSAGRGSRSGLTALRLGALGPALAGLMTFGCGTHATLDITAPSSSIAGSPFTITVTAVVGQRRDTVINSAIVFTSSDSKAVLPPRYSFTPNDAGSHTFTDGVTLMTPGSQSITATVSGAPGINGTANVTVDAAIAMQFNVSAPSRSFLSTAP